jgi:Zn-dependent protease
MDFQYVDKIFQYLAFLFAISVHESAHAWMASRCGDPTAAMLGRITLNPLKHIDPIGTVVLPLLALFTPGLPLFGWAKPTPVNPRNFKDPVRDDILTSVAGPVSNAILVLISLLILAVLSKVGDGGQVVKALTQGYLVDAGLLTPLALIFYDLMLINVVLGIFNLIPVPPLDGSHVLRHFLGDSARVIYDRMGMIGLMVLVFFGGRFLGALITPVIHLVNGILLRV